MPLPDALKMAQESDLDLVEVAPLATPPVCRIMDFRKWQYEEKQRAKESRRKASNVSVKEMKYRPKIGVGRLRHQDQEGGRVPLRGPQGQGHDHVQRP